jgi:phage-related protein
LVDESPEPPEPELFRVRPMRQAQREAEVGQLFQRWEERQWVLAQLKLLRHWPLTLDKQGELGFDLDFSRVTTNGETFYELRLSDARLSHGGNLRVFFWVHDESRTVWIAHAYWKKTQRLSEAVKRRVARRIKAIKGQIQDGDLP